MGRVLMISSSAGKYPSCGAMDYGTTKAAMISMAIVSTEVRR